MVADHGSWVVRSVVGSTAYHGASWAGDRLAGRVGWIIGHRGVDDNAALREWVALRTVRIPVDVGEIPEDAVTRPSVLELRDGTRERVIGCQLDGDPDALFGVLSRVTTRPKQLHALGSARD